MIHTTVGTNLVALHNNCVPNINVNNYRQYKIGPIQKQASTAIVNIKE